MVNDKRKFILGTVLATIGVSIIVSGLTIYFLLVSSSASKLRQSLGINDSNVITHQTTRTDKIVVEESGAIIDASSTAGKTVVSITGEGQATQNIFGFGTIQAPKTSGTGFIVTSDGLIATNKHVVSDAAAKYTVTTADGKTYDAKIAATDPSNDIALVKVDAHGLPVADLGNSDDVKVAQWVIAIGNALGELQNSVTVGVISAKERTATPSDSAGNAENLDGLFQTDAAINLGNSGGPLINLKGQVIGINTAIVGNAQSIGFAIPVSDLKKDLDSYKANGKIVQPYLGVRYQPITKALAKSLSLTVDKGALLNAGTSGSVTQPGSPAEKAGLKSGDIITKINSDEVTETVPLTRLIRKYNPGTEVTLTIIRGGKEQTVKVTLGTLGN